MEIPFGISIIATVLKVAGHDVGLFVISPVTPLKKILQDYIREKNRSYSVCLLFPLNSP